MSDSGSDDSDLEDKEGSDPEEGSGGSDDDGPATPQLNIAAGKGSAMENLGMDKSPPRMGTLEQLFCTSAPEHLLDPVTRTLFKTPVIIESGESYELESIRDMAVDPETKELIGDPAKLPVNRELKGQVNQFILGQLDAIAVDIKSDVPNDECKEIPRASRVLRLMIGRNEPFIEKGKRSIISALEECPPGLVQKLTKSQQAELNAALTVVGQASLAKALLSGAADAPPPVATMTRAESDKSMGNKKEMSSPKAEWSFADVSEPPQMMKKVAVHTTAKRHSVAENAPAQQWGSLWAGPNDCDGCGQKVNDKNAVHVGSSKYHEKCFRCSSCTLIMIGKGTDQYCMVEGRPMCCGCFANLRNQICEVCEQTVTAGVGVREKTYHYKCLRCEDCNKKLDHGQHFVSKKNEILCSVCHEKSGPLCPKCNAPVETYLEVLGGCWHAECLVCSQCDCPIMNAGVNTQDGVTLFCERCFDKYRLVRCARCGLGVQNGITAKGKTWHPKCFRCSTCEKPLGEGTFRTAGGKFFCDGCYKLNAYPPCAGCGQAVEDKRVRTDAFPDLCWHPQCFKCSKCRCVLPDSFREENSIFFCEDCYQQDLPKCMGCDELVDGKIIEAMGGSWHPKCFVCVHCKAQIESESFRIDNSKGGAPACDACWKGKMLPQCHKCGKPIMDGACTVYKGNKMHKECFKCTGCDEPITAQFKNVDGKAYCSQCASRRKG